MKNIKKTIAVIISAVILLSTLSIGASAAVRNLDLAFVIDTTGSMSDDIYEVKENMKNYLNDLEETGMNFRIAIIDYRDFSSRTRSSYDYPYKVQLDFTSNYDTIVNAINSLNIGDGGDWEETLCSALIDGVDELSWSSTAGKAVIVMGDAPALDPEPITGYTKEDAISKLNYNSLAYEEELLYKTVSAAPSFSTQTATSRSAITLFAIATSSSSETASDFKYLAEETGGKFYSATNTDAITDSIEEIIEIIPDVVTAPTFWDKIANFFRVLWYIISFQWAKI